ncbi:hypothetical protein PCE1_002314 [Barthelona sp. PCE]
MSDYFTVNVRGLIETGSFPGNVSLMTQYEFYQGPDWLLIDGNNGGLSAFCQKTHQDKHVVWNLPFNTTFQSCNISGWPQIILTMYGLDFLGRQIPKGFGAIHIPLQSGTFTKTIELYRPISSSFITSIRSFFSGRPVEFTDPTFPAKTAGQEVVRTKSCGSITVTFNVTTRGVGKCGYMLE